MMLFAVPMLSVSAMAAEKKIVNNFPLIEVHGFMSSDIYADVDDPDSELIYPWATGDIISMVAKCIPALSAFMITRDYDALADAIVPAAKTLFDSSCCNPDGTPAGNSGVRFEYPKPEKINKHSKLSFRYDWRMDPLDIAVQLNDFIDYVLECSGCDKVALTCHSFGGVVVLSYISMYGSSKVYGVCFNTTAIFGEKYTGQLFSGDIKIAPQALVSFLSYVFEYNDYEQLLNTIIGMLDKAGLTGFLSDFANELIENLVARAIPEVVAPLFACWLPIWAMCPDEYFDAAYAYMFSNMDPSVDYSGLRTRILKYNEVVRKNKAQTLRELDENARVVVISRYGYCSIPLTSDWKSITDGVIDSNYSSFGATTTEFGSTFDEEYLANVDPEFISPDKTVDASTCMFPEKTWFIKDFKHAENSDSLDQMIFDLLFNPKKEATVKTFEKYPRFMQYNADDTVSPDTNNKLSISLFKEFINNLRSFFENIIDKIMNLFR